MTDIPSRLTTFSLAHPEPSRRIDELEFRTSLAVEVAISLIASASPDEFNYSPRLARILAAAGGAVGKARGLLGENVEAASWTVTGAAKVLDADDVDVIAEAIAAEAPSAVGPAIREFIAATWGPAVAEEWRQGELQAELSGAARRAESRLPQVPSAAVADLVTAVTGLRPLADQLREINRFPGARLVFVPSHFIDPSTGYLYGPERCLILFSSHRGLAERLQQEGRTVGAGAVDPEATGVAQVRALKALADPMRLQILRLVAERRMYTSELATALGLTQPAVSHHVTVLKGAGLVRVARSGPFVFVHVVRARLNQVAELISALARSGVEE